jgi:hypothetical protein
MNDTCRRCDDASSDLATEVLLGEVKKGMGGTQKVHARVGRSATLDVCTHICTEAFIRNPEEERAHYQFNSSSCVDQNSDVPSGS